LSPLNDPEKRREYRAGRFDSATGKYDIFVLFVERSIRWLRDGGHYGFVVPSAYRDKDFGQGLRHFLACEGPPTTIVDLLPFGNLLFRAMNTPTLLAECARTTATCASCRSTTTLRSPRVPPSASVVTVSSRQP
jgi:hypothetical protein